MTDALEQVADAALELLRRASRVRAQAEQATTTTTPAVYADTVAVSDDLEALGGRVGLYCIARGADAERDPRIFNASLRLAVAALEAKRALECLQRRALERRGQAS